MAVAFSITTSVSSGSSLSKTVSATVEGNIEMDVAIPANSTNKEVSVSFLIAGVKGYYLLADQDMTVKTNSSGSPDDTITLKANVPTAWITNDQHVSLFTANVTKFYVTNTTAGTLNVRVGLDVTP